MSRLVAPEIIDQDDGGDGKQVKEMDADGEAHHIEDKDDPFVGAGFFGIVSI